MKRRILLLALLTLIGFPLVAFVINSFLSGNKLALFNFGDSNLLIQLTFGIFSGFTFAYFAVKIITTKYMLPVLNKYLPLIKSFELNFGEIVFVSFCAGFGEEIFFREFLQNYLGVFVTAFIFVALHGYLDPRNLKISIYGIFMFVVIVAIGFIKIYFGLISCIIAHTIIDIYLFYFLTFKIKLKDAENF